MIKKSLTVPKRVFAGLGIIVIGIWLLNYAVPGRPSSPKRTRAISPWSLELPEGATLQRTREVTDRAIAYLMARPDVEYVQSVAGSSSRVGTASRAAS